eukprot:TRINITY_DN15657_c0_g1_i1.p2 TRINITY_DN15657_c0_g1~~TRINITY_DN15657_c0_g1_i1.p2  ORF type:complete len:574 (+),score=152.23 TRINITY_DN15657_c0_g1_i1:67-1788(+)
MTPPEGSELPQPRGLLPEVVPQGARGAPQRPARQVRVEQAAAAGGQAAATRPPRPRPGGGVAQRGAMVAVGCAAAVVAWQIAAVTSGGTVGGSSGAPLPRPVSAASRGGRRRTLAVTPNPLPAAPSQPPQPQPQRGAAAAAVAAAAAAAAGAAALAAAQGAATPEPPAGSAEAEDELLHPTGAAVQWQEDAGALPAGNDLDQGTAASAAEAQQRCGELRRCGGFTYFRGPPGADLPRPLRVYYKTLGGNGNGDVQWAAWSKRDPEDVAVDGERWEGTFGVDHFYGLPVPQTPAAARVRPGAFDADYDVRSVDPAASETAFGGAYRVPAQKKAFSYPPRNDKLYITLSLRPRVLYFPELLSDKEVRHIRSRAAKLLYRSTVADPVRDGNGSKPARGYKDVESSIRNSQQAWLPLERGMLRRLSKRLLAVVNHTVATRIWHEQLQVLRYGPREHYYAHTDYFPNTVYGKQQTNRMATFFLHLGDCSEGGQTALPLAGGGRHAEDRVPPHPGACGHGLRVWPRKGAGFVFYNMRPDWSLDPYALHAGCDVIRGEKWVAPLWVHLDTPPEYAVVERW